MRPSLDHSATRLDPYVPDLLRRWSPSPADPRHMRVTGSLAFVDISGFTRLTERLARNGKVGAEEMSDVLHSTFTALLTEARDEGGDLVKWGGDAVLLLFDGDHHAVRAARATHRMRATMARVGRVETSSGAVRLRMSAGIHSGAFDLFLVGDPALHRELLISGPGASVTAEVEAAAAAGQIGLSAGTVALLPRAAIGAPSGAGRLLRRAPGSCGPVPTPVDTGPTTGPTPDQVIPAPIRDHLLTDLVEPEHRTIAVAFVQFSGTDELMEREGPAAVAEALDEVVRNVQSSCARHGVTFFETDINRDGGKVMLTAGAPRGAGDLEDRLLRVARQVLDRAGRLPLRIGMNRGHVFAADFGPAFRRTYSVKGDAINLAARLMGAAASGQALATLDLLSGPHSAFRTVPLPPFHVKGKAEPVHAAAVEELVGPGIDASLEVGLVGRESDLAVLVEAVEEAGHRRGRAVEVVGEAGIGKTRLVAEMLDTTSARSLTTRCEPYESSTPYFPFRQLLGEALGLPLTEAPELRLAERVAALAPDQAPWAPLVGLPLDLRLPGTPETADLEPEFRAGALQSAVVAVLTAACPDSTVFVVEDVQYADEASAGLLAALASAAETRPWVVVSTRRDQPGPEHQAEEPATAGRTTLRLTPLDAGSCLEIARRALRDHRVGPQAMAALSERSGGNPLFLEALVRQVGRTGAGTELPDRIETLLTREVDRLATPERRALRYAAVLGAVVDERSLRRLLGDEVGSDGSVLGHLDQFLLQDAPGRLRFRSVIMREVAYEGLPYRERRRLHAQAGRDIEQSTDDPLRACEVLSVHYFHAGDALRAWRYSMLAGGRAAAKHAHGDAAQFYERAVRSAPRDGSVPAAELATAYESLADADFLVGDVDAAGQAYAEACRLVRDDPVRRARLVEKGVRVGLRHRRFSQAMRSLSRGLRELDGRPSPEAAVARSLLTRRYAYCRFAQGRIDEALRWAGEAAGHAREAGDQEALARAWEMLNAIHVGAGRPEPQPYGRWALEANRELGALAQQAHCLNNLAVAAFTEGRWDEALTSYREAAEIFRRVGDAASEGNARYNQSELLVRQGRFEEAHDLVQEVVIVANAVGDEELVALALREQSQVHGHAGLLHEALSALDRSRGIFEVLGLPEEVGTTELIRGELLLRAGRAVEAAGIIALVSTLDPGGATLNSPRGRRLSAGVAAALGRPDEAREHLMAGLAAVEESREPFEHALLALELAGLSGRAGDAERARSTLRAMGVSSR